MAINVGYEILADVNVSDDKKAQILGHVAQVTSSKTLSIAYAATYSAGTTSKNQASLTIGGTPTFGIRLIMDSAVVGTTYVARLLSQLISILIPETIVLSHSSTGAYVSGDRTYNVTITVT
jgi:hypothetical protein